ncbi:MAG: hypothetical protein ACI9H8_002591 [Lysobacterales bacterium]|jgi:hypothetical protein
MANLNQINIINNFLTPDLQLEVLKALRAPGWSIGRLPVIVGDNRPPSKLWHLNGLERLPLFSETIFKIICGQFNTNFTYKRIYANGQLACQKGNIHQDDGDVTFLYYPLQEWLPEWGGNLMFYDGQDVARCVSYVPNRAIAFPAMLKHGAEAPSRDYPGMRVSIGFKLMLPVSGVTA